MNLFLCIKRVYFNYIDLLVAVQLSQHHLLKRLLFSHVYSCFFVKDQLVVVVLVHRLYVFKLFSKTLLRQIRHCKKYYRESLCTLHSGTTVILDIIFGRESYLSLRTCFLLLCLNTWLNLSLHLCAFRCGYETSR